MNELEKKKKATDSSDIIYSDDSPSSFEMSLDVVDVMLMFF